MAFKKEEVDQLLAQTGRRCCICRERHSVQVHHIVAKHEGGSDEIDNGIPLCPTCHDRVHGSGGVGTVTRRYTPSELREHRTKTIELVREAVVGPRDVSAAGILRLLGDSQSSLARCLSEALELATFLADNDLAKFCHDELTGHQWRSADKIALIPPSEAQERMVDAYATLLQVTLPPWYEADTVFAQMDQEPEKFVPTHMLYPGTIAEVESAAAKSSPKALVRIQSHAGLEGSELPEGWHYTFWLRGDAAETVVRQVRASLTKRVADLAYRRSSSVDERR